MVNGVSILNTEGLVSRIPNYSNSSNHNNFKTFLKSLKIEDSEQWGVNQCSSWCEPISYQEYVSPVYRDENTAAKIAAIVDQALSTVNAPPAKIYMDSGPGRVKRRAHIERSEFRGFTIRLFPAEDYDRSIRDYHVKISKTTV